MKKLLQLMRKAFGVDEKGRPGMPNSRKQILIGGLVCFAIWPGVGVLLWLAGWYVDTELIYILITPWWLITFLGIVFTGQALLSTKERPKYEKIAREKRKAK